MQSPTINKHSDSKNDRDFDYLRELGLKHVQTMSGELWTDYNAHDPGVTFLESLCYAITDLGNRIAAPIPDLMASSKSKTELRESFPSAREILTSAPLSESDYRKIFVDIPGVKNAFIRPNRKSLVHVHSSLKDEVTASDPMGKLSYAADLLPHYEKKDEFILKGLNDVFFELDSDLQQRQLTDPIRKQRTKEIIAEIRSRFHANRCLCEDLVQIAEVGEFEFQVCGDIEIDKSANAVDVVVDILFQIQEHVSPSIQRYSLSQLMEDEKPTDEIFNGPVLEHGFITDQELANANFKTEVRLSDLIQLIAETSGVARIRELSMMSCPCNEKEGPEEECAPLINPWKICFSLDFDKVIKLCLKNSIFNVFKDVIPINLDPDQIRSELQKKFEEHNRSLELSYDDLEFPDGQSLDSGIYHSIQNDLPAIYGVGELGLSPQLPEDRHAKMLQLKAYLSFFDQILASYFSHLKNIGQLLSTEMHGNSSYYLEKPLDVKDLGRVLVDEANYERRANEYLGELEDFTDRKGQFLDHLLARFAENMNDYVFLMIDLFGMDTRDASLWHKAKMLEEYRNLGYNRAKAFNYFGTEHGVWDSHNVSGLQHRIARLLGIRNYARRDITEVFFEVFPQADADPSDEWTWRVKNNGGGELFTGLELLDSKADALQALWRAIALAWDKENYLVEEDIATSKWLISLTETSGEVISILSETFNNEQLAKLRVDTLAAFMFDEISDEGMFLFENILLRPDLEDPQAGDKFMSICMNEDCTECKAHDPYSFRLHIVLPGWTERFSNMHFREFAENAIRKEIPAHILARVCWIGSKESDLDEGETSQMKELELLYKKWLTKRMAKPQDQMNNQFLKPLVDLLHRLDTIYPTGILHDCNLEGEGETSIVLNRSSIGELKDKDNGSE